MKLLVIQQIQELRRQLDALRGVLPPPSWRRADSLLRKATLNLALIDAEWEELWALLCPEDTAVPAMQPDGIDTPKRAISEDAPHMAAEVLMREENERPAHIQLARTAARRLSRN